MRAGMVLAILVGTALPACAGEGFDIVIPGRPGVPVIINGVDASYAVVEGDWGLGKCFPVPTTVYGGRVVESEPNVGHYYPSLGRKPGYGRLEIEPPANRTLPKPAESYHESWSAASAPPKAQPPAPEVPFYPPPVIGAPQNNGAGMMPDPAMPSQRPQLRQPGQQSFQKSTQQKNTSHRRM